MGLGGISIWQLLIVLVIVLLLFGTKRLRSMGSDLGGAVRGFRSSLNNEGGADGANPDSPEGQQHKKESESDPAGTRDSKRQP